MDFLKRLFPNVIHEKSGVGNVRNFAGIPQQEMEAHLAIARYGNFTLTDAIRPSYDLKVVPRQGYRHDQHRDIQRNTVIPVLMISVTRQHVFDVFFDLLNPLGNSVDVVLETSHHRNQAGHTDLCREQVELPVLKSHLWDYEDLLLNDGCAGIAVVNSRIPLEVQLDEHKLLLVYGYNLRPFERILRRHRVACDESIRFVTEAEHVHLSRETYIRKFREIQMTLGMDYVYR